MWPGAWVIAASGRHSMATAWGTHQPRLNSVAPVRSCAGLAGVGEAERLLAPVTPLKLPHLFPQSLYHWPCRSVQALANSHAAPQPAQQASLIGKLPCWAACGEEHGEARHQRCQ